MENLTLQIILAIAGCIALLIGLFGGGVKAKEIEIPKMRAGSRILSSLVGITLIGTAILYPWPPQTAEPSTTTPVLREEPASPAVRELPPPPLPTELPTEAPTEVPTTTPINTPTNMTPLPTATYTPPPPMATDTPSPISLQLPSDYPGWIDTGIDLNVGQAIEVTAFGGINIYAGTPRAETDPNGNYGFDCSTCIVKTQPVGLLLGRIGRPGNPIFRIGTGVHLTAGSSDRLFLLINDCCYQDNIGAFSVTVIFH